MTRALTIHPSTVGLSASGHLPADARSIVWQFRGESGDVVADPAGKVRVGPDRTCDVVSATPFDLPRDRVPADARYVEALAKAKPDGFGAVLARSLLLRLATLPAKDAPPLRPRDVFTLRLAVAAAGSTVELPTGTYDLGDHPLRVVAGVTLRAAAGARVVLRMKRDKPTSGGAIEPRGPGVTIDGLAFSLDRHARAVHVRRGAQRLALFRLRLLGDPNDPPGGLVLSEGGHDWSATDCVAEGETADNFVYASDGTAVTLDRCRHPYGSRHENGFRFHRMRGVALVDCVSLVRHKSPLRCHEFGPYTIHRGTFGVLPGTSRDVGLATFGPMADGDGGERIQDPKRRAEALAYRTSRVRSYDVRFHGLRLTAGLSDAVFEGGEVTSGHVRVDGPYPAKPRPGDVVRPRAEYRIVNVAGVANV